ncbi:MAG: dipeptidase [Candidatus Binatia bacterium]
MSRRERTARPGGFEFGLTPEEERRADTSHCGRKTTFDACEISDAPVIANHTSARGVYDHARGKSDAEIEAIASTGGLVGIVTVPCFLSPEPAPTVEAVLDHIDHVVKLVGPAHVGIGTDWPMQAPDSVLHATLGAMVDEIGFRPEDRISVVDALAGFYDHRDMPNITRGLVKRGYSDEEIAMVLGQSFLRVVERVCG